MNKKNNIKKIILFFIFLAINTFYILLLSTYSKNIPLEIYKWLQIIGICFLISSFVKNKTISLILINITYTWYLILINYFILTKSLLDYSFLIRNIENSLSILSSFIIIIIITIAISLINSNIIKKASDNIEKRVLYIAISIIIIASPTIVKADKFNNEIIYFIQSINQKSDVINHYQSNIYNKLVKESINSKNNILQQAKDTDKKQLPKYLDNIIILQLESLSKFLINQQNTPNFLNLSQKGIYFPNFYGNSVQTILAQENILCSLPSSFDVNLVESGLDKKILCLPEVFKNLGYKTFFIKSYDLNFAKTGDFMNHIMFDEVHADDIMKVGDPKTTFGYREDIFYERTFNYLEKNKKDNSNFFYIEVGPTNHWPFQVPSDFNNSVPFKNPQNHREKLANTTYAQDQYLKNALDKIDKMFPEKNYTLLVFGDHSWPIEMHSKNTFNEIKSYEENFLTSMIMIVGNEQQYQGKTINTRYSEMDIMPSLLDFFQIKTENNKFRKSFMPEISNNTENNHNIILIQPYSNKYFNLINYPSKYQYDNKNNNLILYDLKNNPNELGDKTISTDDDKTIKIINNLISSF